MLRRHEIDVSDENHDFSLFHSRGQTLALLELSSINFLEAVAVHGAIYMPNSGSDKRILPAAG